MMIALALMILILFPLLALVFTTSDGLGNVDVIITASFEDWGKCTFFPNIG